MRYRLALRADSAVAVSAMPGTGFQSMSPGFIPGSTLRGTLAHHYLDEHGKVDDTFKLIFLSGAVQFPNLYPAGNKAEEVGVIPVTARTCKRFQGFGSEPSEHGVTDMLMAYAAAAVENNTGPLKSMENCRYKGCVQPLARFDRNFYLRSSERDITTKQESLYESARAKTRLITRVGIDGNTGTASQGILYSMEVINEGQVFAGDLVVDEEAAGRLCELMQTDLRVHVGQARSRGLGLTEVVSFEQLPENNDGVSISDRFAKFNSVLSSFVNCDSAKYFTLGLQADAIVQDVFMRYLGYIPADWLAQKFGLPESSVKLVWHAAEVTPVRGWNSAHGIYKPGEMGILRGSVFLYEYNGDTAGLVSALSVLEEEGVGNRRPEGFGRVTVCNPFHWEVLS